MVRAKKKNHPLKPGDLVNVQADDWKKHEVLSVGDAGFMLRGVVSTRYWYDRGKAWSSDEMDTRDQQREKFATAARGARAL